jgi:hypothetical protein
VDLVNLAAAQRFERLLHGLLDGPYTRTPAKARERL